jgi:ABC-2 type transport system permease protein
MRLVAAAWLFDIRSLSRSGWFMLMAILQPIVFATIAFYMFEAGRQEETLLYAALGAGLMGIWSTTLFGSGGVIQWERWQGTLEILVAAPAPFVLVVLAMTLATSTTGCYALLATLLWGKLLFGIPFTLAHPLLFFVAVPVTVVALGLMGLLLASTFVLYRYANALSNLLEYPVWLVTGLLVPVALLPGWVAPLSWILAPTWGVRAVREAALGGSPLAAIGMCVLLGVAYLGLGALFLRLFERLARERATLSLT